MYFYDDHYFSYNKIFFSLCGVWPFEEKKTKYYKRAVMMFTNLFLMITQVRYYKKSIKLFLKFINSNLSIFRFRQF